MVEWEGKEADTQGLTKIYADFFWSQRKKIAREVVRRLDGKAEKREYLDWTFLVKPTQKRLAEVGSRAAQGALGQLRITDEGIVQQADEAAADYAEDRAAELVGMKWLDGRLVENPTAAYAITDATRDAINDLVSTAVSEGWAPRRLASAIEEAAVFSDARADMVARTELAFAHSNGNFEGWKASGVVEGKQWLVAGAPCEDCVANEAAGVIGLEDEFPSGDAMPPAHPNCECDVAAVLGDQAEAYGGLDGD